MCHTAEKIRLRASGGKLPKSIGMCLHGQITMSKEGDTLMNNRSAGPSQMQAVGFPGADPREHMEVNGAFYGV